MSKSVTYWHQGCQMRQTYQRHVLISIRCCRQLIQTEYGGTVIEIRFLETCSCFIVYLPQRHKARRSVSILHFNLVNTFWPSQCAIRPHFSFDEYRVCVGNSKIWWMMDETKSNQQEIHPRITAGSCSLHRPGTHDCLRTYDNRHIVISFKCSTFCGPHSFMCKSPYAGTRIPRTSKQPRSICIDWIACVSASECARLRSVQMWHILISTHQIINQIINNKK